MGQSTYQMKPRQSSVMTSKGRVASQSEIRNAGKSGRDTGMLTRCESALEVISAGLDELELCALEGLSGARYIDIAARLNAQKNAIDKIVEPLKQSIKTKSLTDNQGSNGHEFVEKGVRYQAVIRKITKTVMDGPAVKAYLKGRLAQFMTQKDEVQVTFEIKE